jgi:hypothetical protein
MFRAVIQQTYNEIRQEVQTWAPWVLNDVGVTIVQRNLEPIA